MSPVVDAPYANLAARHRALGSTPRRRHTAVFAAPGPAGHPRELHVDIEPASARAEVSLFVDGAEAWGTATAHLAASRCGNAEATVTVRLRDDLAREYLVAVSVMWIRDGGEADSTISVAGSALIESFDGAPLRLPALRWHPYNCFAAPGGAGGPGWSGAK
jgi:hypothetical protein